MTLLLLTAGIFTFVGHLFSAFTAFFVLSSLFPKTSSSLDSPEELLCKEFSRCLFHGDFFGQEKAFYSLSHLRLSVGTRSTTVFQIVAAAVITVIGAIIIDKIVVNGNRSTDTWAGRWVVDLNFLEAIQHGTEASKMTKKAWVSQIYNTSQGKYRNFRSKDSQHVQQSKDFSSMVTFTNMFLEDQVHYETNSNWRHCHLEYEFKLILQQPKQSSTLEVFGRNQFHIS
uniref:Uncharacterized protein n=1 Tax=Romanomermis culicivorax TaxID=13658 RepID=A0A915JFK3_ROMCU